jgi:Ca2+-binding EF-hand superfamily protein
LGGIAIGRLEGWSLVDSIYYAFITAGTVGYGDVSPTSPGARLWAVIFIPLAVAAAGDVLGTVTSSFLEHRRRQVYESFVDQELTMKDLDIMDTDKNGRVTRDEYVDWMLVQLDIVRKEQLDELYAQFDRLDVTRSGYLDEDDLKLMAKLKRMNS